jgi:hypothetical protein
MKTNEQISIRKELNGYAISFTPTYQGAFSNRIFVAESLESLLKIIEKICDENFFSEENK